MFVGHLYLFDYANGSSLFSVIVSSNFFTVKLLLVPLLDLEISFLFSFAFIYQVPIISAFGFVDFKLDLLYHFVSESEGWSHFWNYILIYWKNTYI